MVVQKIILSLLIITLTFSTLLAFNTFTSFISIVLLLAILLLLSCITIVFLYLKQNWRENETFAVCFMIMTIVGLGVIPFVSALYTYLIAATLVLTSFLGLTNYALDIKKHVLYTKKRFAKRRSLFI